MLSLKCYSSCGYGNALSFKNIEDYDIEYVEKHVREKLSHDCTLEFKQHMGQIFGSNGADLNHFQFRRGDKQLIKELVDHVKITVNQFGCKHFMYDSSKPGVPNSAVRSSFTLQLFDHNPNKQYETKSHFFLSKLLLTAERNSRKNREGYRYEHEIKLFSAYLRMIVGPLAYETIQKNLEAAIPSLPSTNRYIRSYKSHITEGILRFEELKLYLDKRNLPLVVSLSEDATRIVDKVQYDVATNQLIGFVPPLNKRNGLPTPFQFPARSANEILNHFKSDHAVSSFMIVIMAQPISNAPPFCLLIFGTDNKHSAEDVSNRWKHITAELKKVNIDVLTIASDSDPKYNAAMRKLSKLGQCAWHPDNMNIKGPFYIQDIVHIATKLRNFLLRFNWRIHDLPFGKYCVKLQHLYELMNSVGKDRHFLTHSTLNPTDRQNFQSVRRMCSQEVIGLLREKVKNSDGTIQYLNIIRDVIDAFMEKNLKCLQRVRKIWYSLFLIRIWRQFIISSKRYTLKNNFLTANCYSCIELNAQSLILVLLHLKKVNKPELFLPHLYDSQPCESTFRQFRSMTTAYSTITNCSMKEALSRISKIDLQNDIMQATSPDFVYPRLKKHTAFAPNTDQELPTAEHIFNEVLFSRRIAIKTATKLGLISNGFQNDSILQCKIKPYTSDVKSNLKPMKTQTTVARESFKMPSLKNIQLKDYNGKLKRDVIDENSAYAEIKSVTGKRIVVKKTSLCWLLRRESAKVSSDRLQRVKFNAKTFSKVEKNIVITKPRLKCYSIGTLRKHKK